MALLEVCTLGRLQRRSNLRGQPLGEGRVRATAMVLEGQNPDGDGRADNYAGGEASGFAMPSKELIISVK